MTSMGTILKDPSVSMTHFKLKLPPVLLRVPSATIQRHTLKMSSAVMDSVMSTAPMNLDIAFLQLLTHPPHLCYRGYSLLQSRDI